MIAFLSLLGYLFLCNSLARTETAQVAVTSDDSRCSRLGEKYGNGNVVDSAVIAASCIATLNQQSSGFGGYFSLFNTSFFCVTGSIPF